MLTILLSLFVNVSVAQDRDHTSNGSVVGRPATSIDCAKVRIDVEAMNPRDTAMLQQGCLEEERLRVQLAREASEGRVAELDALSRFHVLSRLADTGATADFYMEGDKAVTGDAALYASAFASPRTGFGGNGVIIGQSFAQFGSIDALDRSGGYSGSVPVAPPPRQASPTPPPQATVVTPPTDDEIIAADQARRQAELDATK